MRIRQMTPFFYPLLSILICKIPPFLAESDQFGQIRMLVQKLDTLRILKIYIVFCLPAEAKYPIFKPQLME